MRAWVQATGKVPLIIQIIPEIKTPRPAPSSSSNQMINLLNHLFLEERKPKVLSLNKNHDLQVTANI